ncbi:hypothetical protein B4123_2042 [Bacillus paralicheniformis]|uniref:Uncharacterized protein n=1 Tax=Bacillus paralicheniformis TaxID=1648923 RepID=A0A6I7TJU5_9BACI|nr:hypothetical protein B4121_0283 [Bacillus paralicheniformis]OLG11495.1 hypothetical protein B4123_2037 [Bacillus paralicheniformis]OLG11500.1 hypothetical protein B4123_2042 [Bacillus paralicheniformis]TWJ58352.1 hypothetical protein CHCC5023_1186 [Bacillus paralicheniformis]TWJ58784.1 hypothetical protein CHCC5022_3853 [Bacillus paralicheniformis]
MICLVKTTDELNKEIEYNLNLHCFEQEIVIDFLKNSPYNINC